MLQPPTIHAATVAPPSPIQLCTWCHYHRSRCVLAGATAAHGNSSGASALLRPASSELICATVAYPDPLVLSAEEAPIWAYSLAVAASTGY